MAILEDFLEHKDETLKQARNFHVSPYLNIILKLLPAEARFDPPDVQSWSDADVGAALARVRAALERSGGGREALVELEAVLLGEASGPTPPALLTHRINGD